MVLYKWHQYQVVGRALPTESDEQPKIYRMKLWATNDVRAKSKFWYFLRKLKKVKKSNGQVLAINEIFEKNPTTIKNYGIWLRYQSRTGYHNMYKEYRDTTLNGSIEQMYTEMARVCSSYTEIADLRFPFVCCSYRYDRVIKREISEDKSIMRFLYYEYIFLYFAVFRVLTEVGFGMVKMNR